MSFLDQLLAGVKRIAIGGSLLPARPTVNFVSGMTGADNPATESTDLTPTGGGGFGGLSGDVVVSGGSPVAAVVASVTGGGGGVGGGNAVPIFATETRLNSGQPNPVHSFTAALNTTNDTTQIIVQFDLSTFGAAGGTCIADFSVSFATLNPSNGDFFRCDLTFTAAGVSGAFAVTPTSPTPQNVRSSGAGSGCTVDTYFGAGTIHLRVTGIFGATYHWSCIGQVQIRV